MQIQLSFAFYPQLSICFKFQVYFIQQNLKLLLDWLANSEELITVLDHSDEAFTREKAKR